MYLIASSNSLLAFALKESNSLEIIEVSTLAIIESKLVLNLFLIVFTSAILLYNS